MLRGRRHISIRRACVCRYWVRFWLGTWLELPAYAAQKRRYGYMAGTLATESLYWAALVVLYRFHPTATTWALVVPFFVSTFALMFGNWSQHIFVDPDDPHNAYKATYNCLACGDNART